LSQDAFDLSLNLSHDQYYHAFVCPKFCMPFLDLSPVRLDLSHVTFDLSHVTSDLCQSGGPRKYPATIIYLNLVLENKKYGTLLINED
jgi:hypothetical protein